MTGEGHRAFPWTVSCLPLRVQQAVCSCIFLSISNPANLTLGVCVLCCNDAQAGGNVQLRCVPDLCVPAHRPRGQQQQVAQGWLQVLWMLQWPLAALCQLFASY